MRIGIWLVFFYIRTPPSLFIRTCYASTFHAAPMLYAVVHALWNVDLWNFIQAAQLWPDGSVQALEAFIAPTSSVWERLMRGGGGGEAFSPRAHHSATASTSVTAPVGGGDVRLARAVHCRPWALKEAWGGLVVAARAQ